LYLSFLLPVLELTFSCACLLNPSDREALYIQVAVMREISIIGVEARL
jgi:hypothetical protein